MKNIFLVSTLSLFVSAEAFAGKGVAIKLEVTDNAQQLINAKIRTESREEEMSRGRKHHVTIGFIENTKKLDDNSLKILGASIINEITKNLIISEKNPLRYTVESVGRLPQNNIVLMPTSTSVSQLKEVNKAVNEAAESLGYKCNDYTKPEGYLPHMSLYINPKDDRRLKKAVNDLKATHHTGELFFNMFNFSYSIVNK